MSAILDLLYREYCRARLAEMRKQLLLLPDSHALSEANCGARHPADAADQGSCSPVDALQDTRHLRR